MVADLVASFLVYRQIPKRATIIPDKRSGRVVLLSDADGGNPHPVSVFYANAGTDDAPHE